MHGSHCAVAGAYRSCYNAVRACPTRYEKDSVKKTQLIELLANIRATAVSFFSILMFVALGVGIFLGILWVGTALFNATDKEFDEGKLHHFQVLYPYGLTKSDIAELAQVDGVEDVEGGYISQEGIKAGSSAYRVKFQSLPERMTLLKVVDGELPTKRGQVAVLASFAETQGIEAGDSITLKRASERDDSDAEASSKFLIDDSYTVSGIVESPEYVAESPLLLGQASKGSGTFDGVCYVVADAFDPEAFQNAYPLVNVRASIDAPSSYGKEYEELSDSIEDSIERLGSRLAAARYNQLHGEAESKIEEGEGQLDEAKEKLDEGKHQIEDAEQQLADAQAQLEQKEKELADGKQQIADGEKQLADGQAQLDQKRTEAEQKLTDAAAQLNDGYARLEEGWARYNEGKKAYDDLDAVLTAYDKAKSTAGSVASRIASEYSALKQQLAEGKISQAEFDAEVKILADSLNAELDAAFLLLAGLGIQVDVPRPTPQNLDQALASLPSAVDAIENLPFSFDGQMITIAQAREMRTELVQQLDEGLEELQTGEAEIARLRDEYDIALGMAQGQIDAAESQLEEGRQKLDNAKSEAASGEAQLEEGRQKLESGRTELDAKEAELADGENQLVEKEEQLQHGKEQLAGMKEFAWSVLPREYNGGHAEAHELSNVTTRLSFSMALLFVVVGLLVCYSAVSRIVHEQVVQIGTKKALGLRGREITASLLLYSSLAVILGAIVGIVVGVVAVEGIINNALLGRFRIDSITPHFDALQALIITGLELLLVLGATWFACRGILKKHAIELLRGEAPTSGRTRFYERWKFWERLPLFTQTVVNNCVNDSRRVFSTVVGVAGCTALIVTALMLNDDVLKSYDRHLEDVYGFDTIAYVDDAGDSALSAAAAQAQGKGLAHVSVLIRRMAMDLPDGQMSSVRVVAPEDVEAFGELYHIDPVADEIPVVGQDGIWVSRAFGDHFGVKPGDTIPFDAVDGEVHNLRIAGYYEFYLTFYEVVMSRELYEAEFADPYKANALLVDTGETGFDAFKASLAGIEQLDSVVNEAEVQGGNFRSFASVSKTVVMVYLALAVLMAIVVLLNLNVMFINEKKRELIVLMINGFSVRDAKRYIYNDSIVLTLLGIALGVVLGTLMGSFTVSCLEPESAYFLKDIDPLAAAAGVIGSAVLAFCMGAIALRRISAFDLVDINKA